jgi:hypothetical protein
MARMTDPPRGLPPVVELDWSGQYRIVPSKFPPINFFESLADPSQMEALWYIESLTNDRLLHEAGDIALVAPEDRVSGPGSSPLMAAFTHIGHPSRFTDGTYGIYYAARDLETAVRETVFHRQRLLGFTDEQPGDLDMRVYLGQVLRPVHDIRGPGHDDLHDPDIDHYPHAQRFGRQLREADSWGLAYRSVRHPGGHCIAVFRPPAASIPVQSKHLAYAWDGRRIYAVYEKSEPLFSF